MRTRSQARRRRQPQVRQTSVESSNLEKPDNPPVVTMADNRTMAQLLEAPTEGYEDAIVIPEITANNFEIKHGLLNLVQNKQFFGHDKEDPHAHIRYFNKITSTMKIPNVPNTSVKLMLFPFSLEGQPDMARRKNPRSMTHGLILNCINSIPFYNRLNSVDQDSFELCCRWPAAANFNQANSGYRPSAGLNSNFAKHAKPMSKPVNPKWQNLTDMLSKFVTANTASTFGSGTLPGNTVTNPKEDLKGITTRSGVTIQGPKAVNHDTEVTKDTMPPANNGSTEDVQPPVVQIQSRNPNPEPNVAPVVAPVVTPVPKASIPFPSRRNDERRKEKANDQIEKFYEIFRDLSFEISFTDALMLMPKFASTLKTLIGNKEKLSELARTPLNENCSAVILNKLPKKLGDPGRFLIPCEFTGITTCNALADLGASINLMPYLRDYPSCFGKEAITFNLTKPINTQLITTINETVNKIDVIDMACDEYSQEVLGFSNVIARTATHHEYAFWKGDDKLPVIIAKDLKDEEKAALLKVLKSHKRAIAWKLSDIKGVSPEFCTHKILMEEDYEPSVQSQRRVNPKIHDVIKKEVEKLLDAGLIYPISDSPWVSPIPIDPKDQEKTTFTCPYGTFAYRRMPFGLCNAPGTFQRCMMAIFHDMIEKTMEVFMDDFSVFGDSFSTCLSHLEKMLKRCEDTNLSLNWEKSHFMVKEGIVLGHKISKSGLEVDRAKVEVIAKLPIDFLSKGPVVPWHCRIFTERFNQDFSKLPVLLLLCLKKDSTFSYSEEFNECPFNTLKRKYVTEDPILIAPSGTCLVNDVAMLIDFRQWGSPRKEKQAFPTYTRMLARL
ncbi:reverse transcriptase domain-containing protein [Tanacetum coccineum]|uniref:Reverse transcriptase domain-containing protein n=1 Tax=Tanacetum coccineum TaxID=301880 RepID=A0ABQ5A2M6_9ASTR